VLVAAATALAWAIPAAVAGGEAFRTEILWRQSAGRIASEGYHARPFWFHLALLPVLLLPWSVCPSAWRGAAVALRSPKGTAVRFALAWVVPVVIAFSLMKGKQLHYLLPEVPGFALLAAAGWVATAAPVRRGNAVVVAILLLAAAVATFVLAPTLLSGDERWRIWAAAASLVAIAIGLAAVRTRSRIASARAVGTAAVAALLAGYLVLGPALLPRYDMSPFAQAVRDVQQSGGSAAHFGRYHGEYEYIGRLQHPLRVVRDTEEALTWARANPHGAMVVRAEEPIAVADAQPLAFRRYRTGYVYLWRSEDVPRLADFWSRTPVSGRAD
jgi:4-amino-4-deoxy-L-arabinose transferase-like glycosyltransferase